MDRLKAENGDLSEELRMSQQMISEEQLFQRSARQKEQQLEVLQNELEKAQALGVDQRERIKQLQRDKKRLEEEKQQHESIREQHRREDTSLKDKLQHEEQEMQTLRRKCAELEDEVESATHNAQLMKSMATQLEAKMDSAIAVTTPTMGTSLEAIESGEAMELGFSAMVGGVGGHHVNHTLNFSGLGQGTLRLLNSNSYRDSLTPMAGHGYGDTQKSLTFAQFVDGDTYRRVGSVNVWESEEMGDEEEEKVEELEFARELRDEVEKECRQQMEELVERHKVERDALQRGKREAMQQCKAYQQRITSLNQQLRQSQLRAKSVHMDEAADQGACVVFGYAAW